MPSKKITKDAANYRQSAEKRHCKDCSMYQEPNECTLVVGFIATRGTCRFWESKKGGRSA